MTGENGGFLEFGEFRIDRAERELLKNGERVPLTIKAFEVLAFLAENQGHTVTKDELMHAVWSDSFVEEANIARIVYTLRKALEEEDNEHQFIQTLPKRGYRFVADVVKGVPSDGDLWPETIGESEPKPQLSTRRPVPYILIGSIAAILLIVIAFSYRTTDPGAPAKPISIAVLPFRPINSDARDVPFDLKFANDLISGLNQSKDLRVRSFSTMREYTDVMQDPLAIGKERGVDYVLESNYLALNGRLQVTSNLFNVSTGSVVAVFKYEGGGGDPFAATRNVAGEIVPKLLASLNLESVAPGNRGTENDEAWRSYVQGMVLSNKRSVEDAAKAIPEFERAIRLDPKYAQGYTGLAHALQTIFINGGDRNRSCGPALEAAKQASELDPTSGDALAMLAAIRRNCLFDIEGSNKEFARAVELSPNSAFIRRYYAVNIMNEGRFDEALEHLRIARELDPNQTFNEKLLGRVLFFARRYDEAIAQSIKAKDLDPEAEQTSFVFMSFELKGEIEKAFEWFLVVRSMDGESEADLNAWRTTYAESGWQGVLRRRLEQARQAEKTEDKINKRARLLEEITILSVQLGENDRAFEYMDRAASQYALFAAQLLINPYLDSVRSDPRYKAILARTWNRNGGSYSVF